MNLAFYGTLRDPEILARAAQEDLTRCYYDTKSVTGWACYYIEGALYPLLLATENQSTPFSLYRDCPESAWHSLQVYEGDEYAWIELEIEGELYRVFVAAPDAKTEYVPWELDVFQQRHKADYMNNLDLWS